MERGMSGKCGPWRKQERGVHRALAKRGGMVALSTY